jgi:hypothetical protein
VDSPKYIRPPADLDDKVRYREEFQRLYGGWFPGDDYVLRKDIGPVGVSEQFANAAEKTQMPLSDVIQHPNLIERLRKSGKPLPMVTRDAHDRMAGGGYWDGRLMGETFSDPTIRAGGLPDTGEFRNSVNHEVQHMAQDYGNLSDPMLGSNPSKSKGFAEYLANPGEVEARVAGIRAMMTPKQRERNSFPAMLRKEAAFVAENGRPMSYYEHVKHELRMPSDAELEAILKKVTF